MENEQNDRDLEMYLKLKMRWQNRGLRIMDNKIKNMVRMCELQCLLVILLMINDKEKWYRFNYELMQMIKNQ